MDSSSSSSPPSHNSQHSSSSSYPHSSTQYSSSAGKTPRSCLIQAWRPSRPTCTFLVKGGGVDDCGVEYTLGYDESFHVVYRDYARQVGVRPSDVVITHRSRCLKPKSTPHENQFRSKEVLCAYLEGMEYPLSVKVNHEWSSERRAFVILDMFDELKSERYFKERSYTVKELYKEWGEKRAVTWDVVTLYLKGKPLNDYTKKEGATIDDAGVFDGATLYGRWEKIE